MSVEKGEDARATKRYLSTYFSLRPNTKKMLDSVTSTLQAYEARESKLRKNREKNKGCPDEDGFITVISKSTAARMVEEDEMGFEDAARELLDTGDVKTSRRKRRGVEEEGGGKASQLLQVPKEGEEAE